MTPRKLDLSDTSGLMLTGIHRKCENTYKTHTNSSQTKSEHGKRKLISEFHLKSRSSLKLIPTGEVKVSFL